MPILQTSINFFQQIDQLDWYFFFFILALMLYAIRIGNLSKKIFAKKNNKLQQNNQTKFTEYLIMSRQVTLPLFVATLCASWYGGIFGVTQIAFEQGLYNFITQGVFWYLSYFVFALFLVKRIRKHQVLSMPELIGNYFGPKAEKLSALLIYFKILPISYAMSFGILIQLFFNISLGVSIAIGLIFVSIYAIFGGFRAVVYTDFIQFLVMIASVMLVVLFSLHFYGGIDYLRAMLPETYFRAFGEHSASYAFAWLFIACGTTFINPTFYQRCFAVQDDRTAIIGILIAILIWFCFDICTTLGGMYARAALPQVESQQAYLSYSLQILPIGFRGLFLAGVVATVLSTLDSFLLISSQTLMYDLSSKKMKKFNLRHAYSIIITALLTYLIAVQFDGHLENVWRLFSTFFSACLLVPVLWGYFIPLKITDNQFVYICILTMLLITLQRLQLIDCIRLDNFYFGNIIATLGLILCCIWNNTVRGWFKVLHENY